MDLLKGGGLLHSRKGPASHSGAKAIGDLRQCSHLKVASANRQTPQGLLGVASLFKRRHQKPIIVAEGKKDDGEGVERRPHAGAPEEEEEHLF